jgi:hypothetical protein
MLTTKVDSTLVEDGFSKSVIIPTALVSKMQPTNTYNDLTASILYLFNLLLAS